jgi:transcriptional regulator
MLRAMYLPSQFKGEWLQHAVPLLRAHPFASLVSTDDSGLPFVSHLPLQLQEAASGLATDAVLLGHVARGNPHWRYLAARPRSVVTCLGAHAYLSPQVYPDLVRVPTWNYLAVHCSVEAVLIEAPDAKDALLKKLIGAHEPAYAAQWRGLDADYQRKMLAGIVGFELRVTGFECKLKLNQHRPEAHDATVRMYEAGTSDQQTLAEWMQRIKIEKAEMAAKDAAQKDAK